MKILAITHVECEKLGAIQCWAQHHEHEVTVIKPYLGQALPHPKDYDIVLVMGGPQCVAESEKYPYLRDEMNLILQAIEENRPLLGICLGAQLLSTALGANSTRSPYKEMGMYPVELLESARTDPIFSKLPQRFTAMHWHFDMPAIPEGAILLAKSEGCPHQAFRFGDKTYGLQFHLEFTAALTRQLIECCSEDLAPCRYVQTQEDILTGDFDSNNQKMWAIMDGLAALR